MARTIGNGFQKLQIALVMANIDLAIIMPAPEAPKNHVRTQNEADDAWAIREKAHDIAWTKWDIQQARWNISNCKCLMIIRGSISDGIRMAISECATATEYLAMVKSQFQDLCCHFG